MAERDRYIPGVPCWVDTSQPDPKAAVAFYGELFGWDLENVMPADAEGEYYIAHLRDGEVAAIAPTGPDGPPMATWNTYIWVDDADDAASKATAAGGTVIAPPFDVMDAGRMAVLADPEGATFCVWQPGSNRGAQVVNEHGSLNFNGLATRDRAGAEAFYGAVFGWRALGLTSGPMWTLPGYGDHLELLNPGTRENMAQMGAPDGFIDVVAAIEPIAATDTETPAHWTVTFGVNDVEAITAKAKELGADILSGPVDAPWVRMSVIKDPQGATFIASQFVVENKDIDAA